MFKASNPFVRHGVTAAAILYFAAAAFAQQQAPPSGVPNFHVVNDHVYRGAQPSEDGLRNLAKMGVKTVIDLREANGEMLAEKKIVEAAGMRFVNIPMRGMHRPADADVAKALVLFEEKQAGPVFVHCHRCADRTGTVVACYRIAHDHWNNEQALKEAKQLGMHWTQKAMQHYVKEFRPAVNASTASPSPIN
jgi:protein tyrosine/serine phosphatase